MGYSDIWLGVKGSEVKLTPFGRQPLQISPIEETRGEEMASGRYVEDILWRKKEFTICYSELTGQNLKTLIDLYNLKQFLNLKYYDENLELVEYEVKMFPFGRTRDSVITDSIWTNVSIKLRQVKPDASD